MQNYCQISLLLLLFIFNPADAKLRHHAVSEQQQQQLLSCCCCRCGMPFYLRNKLRQTSYYLYKSSPTSSWLHFLLIAIFTNRPINMQPFWLLFLSEAVVELKFTKWPFDIGQAKLLCPLCLFSQYCKYAPSASSSPVARIPIVLVELRRPVDHWGWILVSCVACKTTNEQNFYQIEGMAGTERQSRFNSLLSVHLVNILSSSNSTIGFWFKFSAKQSTANWPDAQHPIG